MYCQKCGEQYPDNLNLCPKCGALNTANKIQHDRKVGLVLGTISGIFALIAIILFVISSNAGSNNIPAQTKNAPTISFDEFQAIQTGMTYDEVVNIIGGEGELLSESSLAGYETKMYQWNGDNGFSNANVTIQNNAVVSKAQFGLK